MSRIPQRQSKLPVKGSGSAIRSTYTATIVPAPSQQQIARPSSSGRPQMTTQTESRTTVDPITGARRTVTKVTKRPTSQMGATLAPVPPMTGAPVGQYAIAAQYPPPKGPNASKMPFASPPQMRKQMGADVPAGMKYYSMAAPGGHRRDRNRAPDVLSGSFNVEQMPSVQMSREFYDEDNVLNRRIESEYQAYSPRQQQQQQQFAEQAIQQMVLERRVERTPEGEVVRRHLTATDKDAGRVELEVEQRDKSRPSSENVSEVVSVTSSLVITPTHSNVVKTVTKERKVKSIDKAKISKMIEEETDDVESTLKIVPPDLLLTSPERYPLKKQLQNLRASPESVKLLEKSILQAAPPTADDVQPESPPQLLAGLMQVMDNGCPPTNNPQQIYDVLFDQSQNSYVELCHAAPGPLNDVVIPVEFPEQLDAVNRDVTDAVINLSQSTQPKPPYNLFDGKSPQTSKFVADEEAPWGDDFIEFASIIESIGADPINTLDVSITPDDLSNGVEYFVNTNRRKYESKIQLRGTHPPSWFPGYTIALPEIPNILKISRNPTDGLYQAWRAVQPEIFDGNKVIIL